MANLKDTTVAGTGAATLAVGTSAERPTLTPTVTSFTSAGPATFNVPTGVTSVEVLVVAGGGAGGASYAGGGGAGGLVYHSAYPVTPGGTVSVSVGAGGTAGALNSGVEGGSGTNSTFGNITAIGGGGGGSYTNGPASAGLSNARDAINGGSGGGGASDFEAGYRYAFGTQGPSGGGQGFGHPGGRGSTSGIYRGGGGGGAGGPGNPGNTWNYDRGVPRQGDQIFNDTLSGNGGIGRAYDITGTQTYYAGGGGGGQWSAAPGTRRAGSGGLGGGGAGILGAGTATPGTTNTGGGGGGAGGVGAGQNGGLQGGDGGPGVIIVRYLADVPAGTSGGGDIRYNSDRSRLEGFDRRRITPIAAKTVTSFTATGPATFNVPTGVTEVHVLVVGAGGNGGLGGGGGGGAGGFIEETHFPVTPGAAIPVVVGSFNPGNGASGQNSSFGTLVAIGGGGGGNYSNDNGNPGGSGGGSTGTSPGSTDETQVGQGTAGQGYPGGIGRHSPGYYVAGGGGGGASRPGEPSQRTHTPGVAGRGGDGRVSYITGAATWYAGGGAGAGSNSPTFVAGAFGGVGGGGPSLPNGAGNAGTANTGGGGAGGNHNGGAVGAGGPGIVIVRY